MENRSTPSSNRLAEEPTELIDIIERNYGYRMTPEEGHEAVRNLVGFASVLLEIQAAQERRAAEKVGRIVELENPNT